MFRERLRLLNITCSTQRGSSDDLPAGWRGAMQRSEHSTDPLSPHSQEDSRKKQENGWVKTNNG